MKGKGESVELVEMDLLEPLLLCSPFVYVRASNGGRRKREGGEEVD
jgi:hypothetical protein